jgi:hypothetical protein
MKKKSVKRKNLQNENQKTDSVHQSLAVMKQMILNLEQQIKELSKRVDIMNYPKYIPPKDDNEYWPNHERDCPYEPYIWW